MSDVELDEYEDIRECRECGRSFYCYVFTSLLLCCDCLGKTPYLNTLDSTPQ